MSTALTTASAVAKTGPGSLRAERDDALALFRDLSSADWHRPSAAAGWSVGDVVAHLAASCRAMVTPAAALTMMTSGDIERTNDEQVARWRGLDQAAVVGAYTRWSEWACRLAAVVAKTPGSQLVSVPVGELGRFPVLLVSTAAPVFDHHTHLRHDLAPVLDRTPAPVTEDRMTVVVEWMLTVLDRQLRAYRPSTASGTVELRLRGPGGGVWFLGATGVRPRRGAPPVVATVTARAETFPAWGTRRTSWRDADVDIDGDQIAAADLLDRIDVV